MSSSAGNFALFTGVSEMCELHGENQMISSLKVEISLSILSDVNKAVSALQEVIKLDSFEKSPKVVFPLSVADGSIKGVEVLLGDGCLLQVDFIELIVLSNGEFNCYALSFVDSLTNTSRWQILLKGSENF